MLEFTYEKECGTLGYHAVCGIDEAGRGPLAGNVVAAAVILPDGFCEPGLNDSKSFRRKSGKRCMRSLCGGDLCHRMGNACGNRPAQYSERNDACDEPRRGRTSVQRTLRLWTANTARAFPIPTKTVVGGDAKCPSIAAASILAKLPETGNAGRWMRVIRRMDSHGIRLSHEGTQGKGAGAWSNVRSTDEAFVICRL